ncbi:hypothetical protein C5167_035550 [Papaver somniferum]|uniref:Glycosyltransferase n=1 Tax=Papaver somniferum TaxID=3469 RepID=A0A4Y7KG91_PAPSO|nr:hypothetical protein C5167_035550 [Papaver somniferum]
MVKTGSLISPHVVIFPFPIQGHINSMLKLAEVLCLSGINVTFINTQRNHSSYLSFSDVQSRFGCFPGFCFETISDGLSTDQPHSAGFRNSQDVDMFHRLKNVIRPGFRDLLTSDRFKIDARGPVSCIIADGILGFAIDVAGELGIPSISFRTSSACSSSIYFCLPKLIEHGDVPFKDEDMDRLIKNVPGMESFLRCRDLPSFCRAKDLNHPSLDFVIAETSYSTRATAHLLNTFDIEAPSVSSNASLYKEDRSCMTWLDKQPEKSVVYVSFGSIAMVSREQWLEIWYGLVNSGHRFLWVKRPDSLLAKDDEESHVQAEAELIEATKERGYTVEWAPQEEVLNHSSVGGFFTHSGWNSTLESMVAGVPMVCWPHLADQQINSRYVSEVWKIGMDMKDNCNRLTVEKLIRDLMDVKREELMKSTAKVADMARQSKGSDGSSYRNYEGLLQFIRKTC